ncbi:MAG: hypothetical protein CVV41_09530 [Candidatus Riflebacteria bacterium HGW-Riflebacteria-1]|jgi:hypothetical protein|nr:MAG: hypothetical protein CVV41_09530 [Candidatus Riflebacteria bacterium HGW-Riflebacteria-1]
MLDLDQLKKELTAPVKTLKLQAIESALKAEVSSELLTVLEESLSLEQDPECQLLLQHAIDQNQLKLFEAAAPAFPIDQIIQLFPTSSLEEQLNLIESIKVKDIKDARPDIMLPKLLAVTSNQVVASAVVRKFRRFWPESMLGFLEQNIFSKCKSLQLACIKSLVQRFPQSLKTRLSQIVHVNDPVIRSLAIWSMAKHFPELAADFMNDCLEKGDRYNRLTALQICSTIDFSLIKQSLLNLVTVEADAEIFKLACTVLLNNPDREVPFRILGIIFRTTPTKADFLKKFMVSYCGNLELSGQCDNFADYRARLNDYSRQLQAQSLVYNLLVSFDNETEDEQAAILRHLRYNISDRDVRVAVEDFIAKCQNAKLKSVLLELLARVVEKPVVPEEQPGDSIALPSIDAIEAVDAVEIVEPAEPARQADVAGAPPLPDVPVVASSQANQEVQQIKELARARFSKSPEMMAKIKAVFDNQASSDALVHAALKAAVYVELGGYSKIAEKHLSLQSDAFVAAGLEYLAKFDWDKFHILVNRYINTESFLIRKVLIGATSKAAPDYAKFLIGHLLESRDQVRRTHGLEATVQMDFSFIFPSLVTFLEKEQEAGLIDSCIAIFLANPKLDSLCAFVDLEARRPDLKKVLADAQQKMRRLLISSGIAKEKEIDAFLARRAAENASRKASMEQAKELVKVKNSIKWQTSVEQTEKFDWQRPAFYGFIALVISALLMLFVGPSEPVEPKEKKQPGKTEVRKPIAERDSIAPPAVDQVAGLPKPGDQMLMQLQKYYPDNQTWLARDDAGRDLLVVLTEPEVYIETEFIGVEVDEARYTGSGQIVIFAR